MPDYFVGEWEAVETTIQNKHALEGTYQFFDGKLLVYYDATPQAWSYLIDGNSLIVKSTAGVTIIHEVDILSSDEFMLTKPDGNKTRFVKKDRRGRGQ